MLKKKILMLIGDVGNGHRSAANALTSSFGDLYPEQFEIKTIDLFKESDLWPYNITAKAYVNVSKSKTLEKINNVGFKITNTKYLHDIFTNYTFTQLYEATIEVLKKEAPDVVISIHPMVSMVLERLKEENFKFLSVVVVTDLITIFRGWGDRHADLIFSPTSEAVKTLVNFGADINKIIYPLFPINPKLKNFRPKSEVLKELNLVDSKNIVLVTGGGVGAKSLNKSIEKLTKNKDLQLIIIAGKLEEYKNSLEQRYSKNKNVKVLGYVDNIQDYMNASDIIISKPGPATILEIELFDKKAILTRKIGQQEIGNIEYALRNPKFRYIGDKWGKLESTIEELINLKPPVASDYRRRSFDECDKISEEIYQLITKGNKIESKSLKKERIEDFLAKTILISTVGFGVYKVISKLTKKQNS